MAVNLLTVYKINLMAVESEAITIKFPHLLLPARKINNKAKGIS